jgi:hypothetical protein
MVLRHPSRDSDVAQAQLCGQVELLVLGEHEQQPFQQGVGCTIV